MSSEIDVCIWCDNKMEQNARARFSDLVQVFGEVDACSDEWANFSVQRDGWEKIFELKEGFAVGSLSEITREYEGKLVQYTYFLNAFRDEFFVELARAGGS